MSRDSNPRVGFFVTCLVDVMRPTVGFAAIELLRRAGCHVDVPEAQTCCGQPAFNSGDAKHARQLARQTLLAFEDFDYVVAPSGSCAAMLKVHLPKLLSTDTTLHARAIEFTKRVHELTYFLVAIRKVADLGVTYHGRIGYHDACSGLRELGLRTEARTLLQSIDGVELVDIPDATTCCGFGGLFSVKFPDISAAMVEKKCRAIDQASPLMLVAGELGCLFNIAGKLRRQDSPIVCRHIAEVLAGDFSTPAIGVETKS